MQLENISFLNQENIPINIEISFCNKNIQRSLYIEGSEGSIKWDIKSGTLSLKEREFLYKESFNIDANERIRIQFQHFINVCNKEDIPLVCLEDSLDTLRLIREIRKFKK